MKRKKQIHWFAVLMSIIVLLGCVPTTVVSAISGYPIGDVNLDGITNTNDVRMILRYTIGSVSFLTKQEVQGDYDGNGYVTTVDARAVLKRLLSPEELPPLSGIEDTTDSYGTRRYIMRAEYSDTYSFSISSAASVAVFSDRHVYQTTTSTMSLYLLKDERVTVTVSTSYGNAAFDLEVTPSEHTSRLPYEPKFTVDPATLDLYGDSTIDPLVSAEVEYTKRANGTYIYLNNPEKLTHNDIGQALQRDKGLSGDIEITWAHRNGTGSSIYLGYQLKNEGTTDVYVTAQNIGFQTTGEWLGQQSWSEFYNRKIELPTGYFDVYGNETDRYKGQNFLNYTPVNYQPTTYRIPAGGYIYILGGTSSDAYNHANVASTADVLIGNGFYSNAVAKFAVTGGEVTGTFYCYTSSSQVKAELDQQGYITLRDGEQCGLQYKGLADHQGLVESNMIWYVNDNTSAQNLPVTYNNSYDRTIHSQLKEPYQLLNNQVEQTIERENWSTHLNPSNYQYAVMDDMVAFECVATDGKEVTIDIWHTDGTGSVANLGNWMIDYHDNYTFVNQGSKTRYFTINKNCQGALMTMVMDNQGNILTTKCTISPISETADEREWELYTVEVPPHTAVQVTVSFVLMANSYGGVNNWIALQ